MVIVGAGLHSSDLMWKSYPFHLPLLICWRAEQGPEEYALGLDLARVAMNASLPREVEEYIFYLESFVLKYITWRCPIEVEYKLLT